MTNFPRSLRSPPSKSQRPRAERLPLTPLCAAGGSPLAPPVGDGRRGSARTGARDLSQGRRVQGLRRLRRLPGQHQGAQQPPWCRGRGDRGAQQPPWRRGRGDRGAQQAFRKSQEDPACVVFTCSPHFSRTMSKRHILSRRRCPTRAHYPPCQVLRLPRRRFCLCRRTACSGHRRAQLH